MSFGKRELQAEIYAKHTGALVEESQITTGFLAICGASALVVFAVIFLLF